MPALDLLEPLLRGLLVTVVLTLGSIPVAGVVAFVAGLARLSRFAVVRAAATVIVEVLRGTSLLVQLFVLFYVLPAIGVRLGPLETGIVGLGLNYGAYGSEIVRGAVLAVDQGQRDAVVALNMTPYTAMRRVILPQAVVAMLPPFANSAIELLKSTALTSLITVRELAGAGNVLVLNTNRTGEVLTLVLVLYFLAAYPLSVLGRRLEKRTSIGLNIGRMPQ